MKAKIERFYGSMKNKAAVAGGLMLGAVGSVHAAVDTTAATAAITEAVTGILVIVAAGGAAMVSISLGKVVWVAGANFVSRLAGRT